MFPDVTWPEFNDGHVLSPTGKEPLEERWEAWNDLDFDFIEYQRSYWFWLGDVDNERLCAEVRAQEVRISWSTARFFRLAARADKGHGWLTPKPSYPATLRFVTENGIPPSFQPLGSFATVVGAGDRVWVPPLQVHLTCPTGTISLQEHSESFSKRLNAWRQRRKLNNQNKAHRAKPSIAAR